MIAIDLPLKPSCKSINPMVNENLKFVPEKKRASEHPTLSGSRECYWETLAIIIVIIIYSLGPLCPSLLIRATKLLIASVSKCSSLFWSLICVFSELWTPCRIGWIGVSIIFGIHPMYIIHYVEVWCRETSRYRWTKRHQQRARAKEKEMDTHSSNNISSAKYLSICLLYFTMSEQTKAR